MTRAWRLVKERYIDTAFSGEGARRYGGRWNFPGQPAVYIAESQALAVLEMLVHVEVSEAPTDMVLIPVGIPDGLVVPRLEVADLPQDWRRYPAPNELTRLGSEWLNKSAAAVLSVPSVVLPDERNYVINPLHPDARRIEIGDPRPLVLDPRLFA